MHAVRHAHRENSDQTGQILRLIQVGAVLHCSFLGFSHTLAHFKIPLLINSKSPDEVVFPSTFTRKKILALF